MKRKSGKLKTTKETDSQTAVLDDFEKQSSSANCCCGSWEGVLWPQEAESLICDHVQPLPVHTHPLLESTGLYLAEDIIADRDQPPVDKALRDGIAVAFTAVNKGVFRFHVCGLIEAGQPPSKLADSQTQCFEICTGALLPEGADTIIPYEGVKFEDGMAVIENPKAVVKGAFVQKAASSCRKGDLLVAKGQRITPWVTATAAAVGKSQLKVTGLIPIAVIGTGNELIEIDLIPKIHQSRRSNTVGVLASLKDYGFPLGQRFHIRDEAKELKTSLKSLLERFSWLIISGGVSKGKTDLVPEILLSLGCRMIFREVRQRPGKPFLFMTGPQKQMIFGMPGNPVSTAVCLRRFVIPALRKAAGSADPHGCIHVYDEYNDIEHTHIQYRLVRQKWQGGRLSFISIETKTSGDFVALSKSDGFIVLGPSSHARSEEKTIPFYPW